MTKYIELGVETNPVWSEYVAEVLINQLGCDGVVTQEIEYKDEKVVKESTNIVKGYLWFNNNLPDVNKLQEVLWQNKLELINSNFIDVGTWNLFVKTVEDEEWAHSWKKFWKPQKIGSKIVICPSWENYNIDENEIKIELDPGTAFGTGTHPTTRLCIVALEKYVNKLDSIADIGTGSGILSIAGIKLDAQKVVGVDNDPSVIEVAKENALKNDAADKCLFYEGSAKDVNGEYEIVIANILAEVIVSIMDELILLVKNNGKLILSGIIKEKSEMVINAAILRNFELLEILEEDNWVAIVLKK